MSSSHSILGIHESALSADDDASSDVVNNAVIFDVPSFQQSFQNSIASLEKMGNPAKAGHTINSPEHPYIYERGDYLEYINNLSSLEILVMQAYVAAERNNEEMTLNYLCAFNNKLSLVLPHLSNNTLPLSKKLKLIDELITLSKPSPELLEYAEPVVTPIAGLIGGILGAVAGILVGAAVGVGIVLLAMVSSASAPSDIHSLLFFLGFGAFSGACYGAFFGATEGANYLASLNHNTFFKPSQIQDLTKRSLLSKTLERSLGAQYIETEVNNSDTELLPDLNNLVFDYLTPDDKDAAFKRHVPLLRF